MTPSIFNDVIGPVMRGPSSSHCAAVLRIGRLARDLMEAQFNEVIVEFDRNGSLPNTFDSQGSGMGLFGGLLGLDASDDRLVNSAELLRATGVAVRIASIDAGDAHPNTYRLTMCNKGEQHSMIALSTGGGMIEVISIDGFKVSLSGDFSETLFWMGGRGEELADVLRTLLNPDDIIVHEVAGQQLVEVKAAEFVRETLVAELRGAFPVLTVRRMAPVLPVMSRRGVSVPFAACEEMLSYDAGQSAPLWKLAIEYESARGGLSEEEVMARMADIVGVLRRGPSGRVWPVRSMKTGCLDTSAGRSAR